MICLEVQALITRFIKDELEIREAAEFLSHMKECKDCREELEVSFALLTAIYYLDQDADFNGDYKQELDKRLKKLEDKIKRRRLKKYRNWFLIFILFAILSFNIELQLEDVLIQKAREQELLFLNLIPMKEVAEWQNFGSRMLRVDGKDVVKPAEEEKPWSGYPRFNGYAYPTAK